MIWEGYVIRMRKIINAYKFLVWKPKGKRRLDRRMGTRKDNIKMCVWGVWIGLERPMIGSSGGFL